MFGVWDSSIWISHQLSFGSQCCLEHMKEEFDINILRSYIRIEHSFTEQNIIFAWISDLIENKNGSGLDLLVKDYNFAVYKIMNPVLQNKDACLRPPIIFDSCRILSSYRVQSLPNLRLGFGNASCMVFKMKIVP